MSARAAGERVDYTITYLEMADRPSYPRPSLPMGRKLALLRAETPPVWYFLSLYDAVGAAHEWTDMHTRPQAELEAFVQDPQVHLYTLICDGWPAGFFQCDFRTAGVGALAYFGLVPEAVGKGLGTYLLKTAIHTLWDGPGVARLTVETCTLDHPRALPLYQKMGFVPSRQASASRVLTRPHPLPEEL